MPDVNDPLQDSFERKTPKPAFPLPDKKIIFGARKPTEAAATLTGIPLIIEAPFPSERTLQWLPGPAHEATALQLSDVDGDEAIGFDVSSETAVVVSQEVLLKVNEHVSQSLERELGGFLLGNRYRCPNSSRDYVIIDQYSPAKFTESNEVRLAFTHEAWAQLSDELSGKFLGKLLVGWYHSHPRMDVFLSSHDMEIQTERFPESWMVALVLEPEKHRGGFFCSRNGRIKPNSPVDFFELLERNSRDSVLAWENYAAVDPSTSSTPIISETNTASSTNTSSQEIVIARSQQSKKVTIKPRRRRRWLATVVAISLLALAAVGVVNRKRLRGWWQNRNANVPAAQPSPTLPEQQSTVPTQVQTPTPIASPTGSPQEQQTQPQQNASPQPSTTPQPTPSATQTPLETSTVAPKKPTAQKRPTPKPGRRR